MQIENIILDLNTVYSLYNMDLDITQSCCVFLNFYHGNTKEL